MSAVRARNGVLRALSTVVLEDALALDARLADHGDARALSRVPFSLKDVWDVAGLPTSHGSASEADEPAPTSGPVHRVFENAGAVLVGKSNLSDRALTPECESYPGGVTVHPADARRTSGGSSGGAAVAVATGMAAFDWGTDFGGSIRLPAAFCGVVGLRLSASSWPVPEHLGHRWIHNLNGMGPLATDLTMCRRVIDAAAPLRRSAPVQPAFRGLRLVVPDGWSAGEWPAFAADIAPYLARCAIEAWPAALPPPRELDRVYVAILASQLGELVRQHPSLIGAALSALSLGPRLGDRRLHPRSARVLAELSLLRLVRHRDAARARRDAERLRERVDALFAQGFVLLAPTTTHPAPLHGRALSTRGLASFVKLANLVDATALSVPFATFDGGLPRGLQLLGPAGSELRLIELASAITSGAPLGG